MHKILYFFSLLPFAAPLPTSFYPSPGRTIWPTPEKFVNLHFQEPTGSPRLCKMMRYLTMKTFNILVAILSLSVFTSAAESVEKIRYADFSNWFTRDITESKVIGGKHKTVYEIAPAGHAAGNNPYRNRGGSPWATSNVYAKVSGITKASNSVSPFKRGANTVARLQSKMEEVKVLGIINLDAAVAGTIFLGRIKEPITSTKGPFTNMEMGIPFTRRPKAIQFDFAVTMPPVNSRVRATGLSPKKTLKGRDNAEVYVLLQRRWEDSKGNIYAHRVGTGRERYSRSIAWNTGHRLPIHYGDITGKPFFKSYMGLLDGAKAYYAYNSKGKLVPVHEVGWDPADATPTHVLLMASTSCGEPFVITEGITLDIDNISFVY